MMKNLSMILQEKMMTQRMLSKKTGIAEDSISRYINDLRDPRGETALRIARALGTTVEELYGEEDLL